MRFRALTVALLITAAGAAQAGVIIQSTVRDLPDGKAADGESYYIQDGMIRTESRDASGKLERVTLFRDGVMWMIDLDRHTYSKFDKAAMLQGMQAMNAQLEAMKARMASMPPEQRARIEKLLARADQAPSVTWTDSGRTDSAGQVPCRVWDGARGDRVEWQYCIAGPASMPGGREVSAAFEQFAASYREALSGLAPAMRKNAMMNLDWMNKAHGFPVIRRDVSGGKPYHEERLKSVELQSLPADKFALPKGFTEVPMMGRGSTGED